MLSNRNPVWVFGVTVLLDLIESIGRLVIGDILPLRHFRSEGSHMRKILFGWVEFWGDIDQI
jgi:hypothetical protein